MKSRKTLQVFFDIETFRYNLNIDQVTQTKASEYSVSYLYEKNGKVHEKVVPTIHDMLEDLLALPNKKFELIAFNGEGFDFNFLFKSIQEHYGVIPKNNYVKNAITHKYEVKKKDFKDDSDYLLEQHVKASSKIELEFRINGNEFKTTDAYPKFQCSLKTGGEMLELKGIHQHKQEYKKENYSKFDISKDMTFPERVKYQYECFNKLTDEDKDYVMNDTRTLYQLYKHYNDIQPEGFDLKAHTLTQNIGKQYEINEMASFQLFHKVPEKLANELDLKYQNRRLSYSDYAFRKKDGEIQTIYDYMRKAYNGGLNAFNEKYLGKVLHGSFRHIDLNSSYPSVMYNESLPLFIEDFSKVPCIIAFNSRKNYIIEVDKKVLDNFMDDVESETVKKMIVQYLNIVNQDSVYLTDVHLNTINLFKKKPYKRIKIPVLSFMKFSKKKFGARKVIIENYKEKNRLKELKIKAKTTEEANEIDLAIQNRKKLINGIYGVPALRPYYPLFERINGELVNIKDSEDHLGFRNSERNILFSLFVTAYAFRNLITPLSYNVKGVDDGFIYADTDSIFMTEEYWNTIKDNVNIDKTELGAWDMEHDNISAIVVLNHKKYAFQFYDKKDKRQRIEVHAGGIVLSSFKADEYTDLDKFYKERFHVGVKVISQRSVLTKEGTIAIYESPTTLKVPDNLYLSKFYPYKNDKEYQKAKMDYNIFLMIAYNELTKEGEEVEDYDQNEEEVGSTLYIEDPYGHALSLMNFYNSSYKNEDEVDMDMKGFAIDQDIIEKYFKESHQL